MNQIGKANIAATVMATVSQRGLLCTAIEPQLDNSHQQDHREHQHGDRGSVTHAEIWKPYFRTSKPSTSVELAGPPGSFGITYYRAKV
jgi:hypothetical protein